MKMEKMVNLLVVLSLLIFSSCDNSNKLAERGQVSSKSIAKHATGGTDDESMAEADFMQELANYSGESKSDIEKFLEDSNLDLTAEDKRKVEEIKGQIKVLKDVEKRINSPMGKEVMLSLLNFKELCDKYKLVLEEEEDFINTMKKAIDNLLKEQLTEEDKKEVLKIQYQINNNPNIKELLQLAANSAENEIKKISGELGSLIKKYNR
jgi:hypothetical protein